MSDALIRLDGVSVGFAGQDVLQDVQLSLRAGEIVTLIGPNGAGKTTLVRTVLGLLKPDRGSVQRKPRLRIGYMPQKLHVDPTLPLSVLRFLRLVPGVNRSAAAAALAEVGASQVIDSPLQSISGGELQRVLLARALAVRAEVLLMDEPLAHLDPPHQADWLDCVRELVAQDRTVISVLHELNVALQADELVVMADGLVHHQGAPGDPATHRALQAVFDDRLQILQVQGQWIALPFSSRPPPPAHAGDLAPVLPLRRPA